jgi:hypothetical protein
MVMATVFVASLVAEGLVCSDAAVAASAKNLKATYAELKAISGYPNDSPGPLYSEPELHSLFPRLAAAVSPAEFAQKIVQLSVDARWEADQTGALQEAARGLLDQHASLFVGELSRLTADEEGSVWQFPFAGPHPSNVPVGEAVRRSVCSLSHRSCVWLDRAYREALAREKREH